MKMIQCVLIAFLMMLGVGCNATSQVTQNKINHVASQKVMISGRSGMSGREAFLITQIAQSAMGAAATTYHLFIPAASGDYTAPYVRYVRVEAATVWDGTEMAATPAWTDTAMTLTYNTYCGGYFIVLPAFGKDGPYALLLYDSASPAIADRILGCWEFNYSEAKEVMIPLTQETVKEL